MAETPTNSAQIDYWNEKGGPKWVLHQETLDAQIGPHGEAMIQAAAVRPGEKILDVGCGCGGTTLRIAQHAGAEGHVTGVDISLPMLGLARDRASRQGLSNIEFHEGDAQIFNWNDASFDAAVSRFGVMFFEDPVAAFLNIRRALEPGGRLAFACWRAPQENPWVMLPMIEASKRIPMPEPPPPDAPGPFAFSDSARVERILKEAGFSGVSISPLDLTMKLGGSTNLDDSVDFMFEIGPLSRIAGELDAPKLAEIREAIRGVFSKFHSEEGVSVKSAAWVVTARNE